MTILVEEIIGNIIVPHHPSYVFLDKYVIRQHGMIDQMI